PATHRRPPAPRARPPRPPAGPAATPTAVPAPPTSPHQALAGSRLSSGAARPPAERRHEPRGHGPDELAAPPQHAADPPRPEAPPPPRPAGSDPPRSAWFGPSRAATRRGRRGWLRPACLWPSPRRCGPPQGG